MNRKESKPNGFEPVNQSAAGRGGQGAARSTDAQRQRAFERMRRRKRGKLIFYVITFSVVIVAAVIVSLTVLFRIDHMEVQGETRYSAEEVVKATGIPIGENLFMAKTGEGEAAVLQKLPYIGSVKIAKGLPAKLTIVVEEAAVAGVLEYDGKFVVVSPEGKVLELPETVPEGVAVIKGLAVSKAEPGTMAEYATAEQTSLFKQVTKAIEAAGLQKVTEIDVSDEYTLKVVVDGKFTLKLGTATYLERKFVCAKSILDSQLQDAQPGTLDLTSVPESGAAKVVYNPAPVTSSSSSPASSGASSEPQQEPDNSQAQNGGEDDYHPAVDANGNPVYDSDGDPIYTKDEVYTPKEGDTVG